MSTLITPASLLTITDQMATLYRDYLAGIDAANSDAQTLLSQVVTAFAATDPLQFSEWVPFITGIYALPVPASAAGGVGAAFGGASFGAGTGTLNRQGALARDLYAALEGIRKEIRKYGPLAASTVVDLGTYAAYQNTQAANSCLYHPDFASLFYYAYSQGQQLPAASVFMPDAFSIGHSTITAVNTATLGGALFPTSNGTANQPAAGADSYGNPQYFGDVPMPQGFAPLAGFVAHGQLAINGTCACTITGPNQAGLSKTWTATLDNLALGQEVAFTPTTAGDRLWGAATAIAVAGTATHGSFDLSSTAER